MYIHTYIRTIQCIYMYIHVQIHQYRNLSDGVSNEDMHIQEQYIQCHVRIHGHGVVVRSGFMPRPHSQKAGEVQAHK